MNKSTWTVAQVHHTHYRHDMFQLALYQPDIPGNTGTIMRMAACLGIPMHIIEPAGFDLSDRNLRRAGMDYTELANVTRHMSFDHFQKWRHDNKYRLVLASTKASDDYTKVDYLDRDIILLGRESSGVPEHVHAAADLRVLIKMQPNMRSLNLAVSAAMISGEILRQTRT